MVSNETIIIRILITLNDFHWLSIILYIHFARRPINLRVYGNCFAIRWSLIARLSAKHESSSDHWWATVSSLSESVKTQWRAVPQIAIVWHISAQCLSASQCLWVCERLTSRDWLSMAVQHWSANRCANLRFAKCLLAPGEGNCCSTFRLDISLFVNYVICMASQTRQRRPALTAWPAVVCDAIASARL